MTSVGIDGVEIRTGTLELDLAETSVGIEEVVRATDGTADSNVRDEVNDLLEEARANRFDDVDREATMEGDA